MLIGYARTSTVDQVAGLEAQEAALAATGCTKLFAEQASSVGQRDQLDAALDFVHEGDTLAVARLDRSTADLLGIVGTQEAKKVALRTTFDLGGNEYALLISCQPPPDPHLDVAPPDFIDRPDLRALAYAESIGEPGSAIGVERDRIFGARYRDKSCQ